MPENMNTSDTQADDSVVTVTPAQKVKHKENMTTAFPTKKKHRKDKSSASALMLNNEGGIQKRK